MSGGQGLSTWSPRKLPSAGDLEIALRWGDRGGGGLGLREVNSLIRGRTSTVALSLDLSSGALTVHCRGAGHEIWSWYPGQS